MISYKVLIILTFIINISHCATEITKIQNEIFRCQDNLKLIGFIYGRPFVSYNLVKAIESKSPKRSGPNSENELINSLIISRRTEDKLNDQKNKWGESVLGEDAIRKYLHQFYNEISNYVYDYRAMNPKEYCEFEHSLALKLPFWGNKRVASCVEEISSSFSDNPYSNTVKAYALDHLMENTLPIAKAPGSPDYGKSLKYYNYLKDTIRDYAGAMADFSVRLWCEGNIQVIMKALKQTS